MLTLVGNNLRLNKWLYLTDPLIPSVEHLRKIRRTHSAVNFNALLLKILTRLKTCNIIFPQFFLKMIKPLFQSHS